MFSFALIDYTSAGLNAYAIQPNVLALDGYRT